MSVDLQTQSLFEAIAAVNYARVKVLIDSGVPVNNPNDRGQTPLAVACRQGNLEIVDLLVSAGAQMLLQRDPSSAARINRAVDRDGDLRLSQDEISKLPVRDRPITAEDAIDFNHNRETKIEQFVPIGDMSSMGADRSPKLEPQMNPAQTPGQNLTAMAAAWQNGGSNAEDTYTFDLDEVFAANDRSTTLFNQPEIVTAISEMAMEEDHQIFRDQLTTTSVNPAASEVEVEEGETYVFDLSMDLDRLTINDLTASDLLSPPQGEWEDGETYAIDLDNLDLPSTTIEILGMDQIEDEENLLAIDRDRFNTNDNWEEGATYAIDLDDLDNFDPSESIGGMNLSVTSEQDRILAIDSSLFPLIDGEDETIYDPDLQTSTDIFGQSTAKQAAGRNLTPVYDENATNTSLIAAVIAGDLDLAQQAIEAGASLDRYDWNLGYSPLGMAIDRGHSDIVRCLLAAGANPHCGSISTTALGLAAEQGECTIIQMLLPRGVNVNEPVGQNGWTALLAAIKNGHSAVVQLLVTAGANVNIWSREETPILLAAKCEEQEIYSYLYPLVNTAIRLCADRDGEQLLQSTRKRRIRAQNRPVEKFIEMATEGNVHEVNRAIEVGVEINEIGAQGHTALMAAAYYGHQSIVKILLEAGADPNLLSDDDGLGAGMTALMLTAGSFFASNRQLVAKMLIAKGADINQQGTGGKTALMYAATSGSGYRDCVEMLIAAGSNLDLCDDRGHTVLTLVATAENYQMFNLILQSGASTGGLESIQLIQAAGAGNVERVKSLLSNPVNLNLDRGAAIGNAAAAGHSLIVELLIRAGANLNLSNHFGFTPISSAAYSGYWKIVKLLTDAGADIQAPLGGSVRYSALEYAQMGLYQFVGTAPLKENSSDRQHAQIIRHLEQLGSMN